MSGSKPSYYKKLHHSKISNEGWTFVELDQVLQGMVWFLHHTESTDEHGTEDNECGTLWEKKKKI
jgi:hypothetical protein